MNRIGRRSFIISLTAPCRGRIETAFRHLHKKVDLHSKTQDTRNPDYKRQTAGPAAGRHWEQRRLFGGGSCRMLIRYRVMKPLVRFTRGLGQVWRPKRCRKGYEVNEDARVLQFHLRKGA